MELTGTPISAPDQVSQFQDLAEVLVVQAAGAATMDGADHTEATEAGVVAGD